MSSGLTRQPTFLPVRLFALVAALALFAACGGGASGPSSSNASEATIGGSASSTQGTPSGHTIASADAIRLTDIALHYEGVGSSLQSGNIVSGVANQQTVTAIGDDAELHTVSANSDGRFVFLNGVLYFCDGEQNSCTNQHAKDPGGILRIFLHPLDPGLLADFYPSLSPIASRTVAGRQSDCYTGSPTYDATLTSTLCVDHELGFLTFSDEKSVAVTLVGVSNPSVDRIEFPGGYRVSDSSS